MSGRPPNRRRRVILGIGAAIVVLVAAAAAVFALTRPGDVSNPNVEFRADDPTPTATATATPGRRHKKVNPLDSFEWPLYGYTPDRRRFLPAKGMKPPFRRLWQRKLHALLEFSPVLDGRHLYLIDNLAYVWSIDKNTGKVRWRKRVGRLAASTPAYANGRLYVTVLTAASGQAGRVVAMRARTGKVLWSKPLPSRSESSPLYDGGRVYFGSEDGTVYAVRAGNGHTVWTYRAAGAVKAGLALDGGRLYFGDYAGQVHAIRESTGARVWQVGTSGAQFGLSSGQFYATPAVAYGRVYIGNTDGNAYSFSEASGRLAWRHHTSGYVYSSASVGKVPGGRPAVYLGSYDGTFYALDARSGAVLWSRHEGGSISGGATVVGSIVYYSNNHLKTTSGRNAKTGKLVWRLHTGAFNPVISDTGRLYVTGFSSLFAFRPKRH
jgi:outer membrane protein assembly factor BamB